MADTQIDELDRRILEELQADGRISIRALAERVQISRANAYTRVERMTRTGIIRGFSAHIDPVLSGLSTSAYITLTVRQNAWRDLKKRLEAISEIKHMALVGGEFDVILLVRTPDNESLRTVVLDQLQAIPGVLATRTLLIFEDLQNLPRPGAAAI
jgi:DNA-binding Lrp family transcriptional regulator